MTQEPANGERRVGRRSFLAWASGALAAAIGGFLSILGAGYVASPAFRSREEEWVDVGRAAAVPRNRPMRIEYVERRRDAWVVTERRASVWVVTADGERFIAFDPRCTHLGCPYRWDEARSRFLCPCHTAVFDVSGSVVSGPPPRALDRYPVKVISGRLWIRPQAERSQA